MVFLNKLLGTSDTAESALAKKGFEKGTCSKTCDECSTQYPALVKTEDGDLWNSTKPYGLHLVVPTGKTNWPHDACGEDGTFEHAVARWGEVASNRYLEIGNIKVSVSSLCLQAPFGNNDYYTGQKGDILILPFFIRVSGIFIASVSILLDTYIPLLISARANQDNEIPLIPTICGSGILVSVDMNRAHVFLCSHRTRDRRCGTTAPIFKKEMDIHLRDLGLFRDQGDDSPGGVSVSFINHIGGHKFAANVLIYSRDPLLIIWVARATPPNAKPIIEECILKHRVWPEMVRLAEKFADISW